MEGEFTVVYSIITCYILVVSFNGNWMLDSWNHYASDYTYEGTALPLLSGCTLLRPSLLNMPHFELQLPQQICI